jgi:L-asparaginase
LPFLPSSCAFCLQGLKRPVIFTGSQRPLGETRSDARSNLVGAVELATHDIPEVGIFFNSVLWRAVRTVKTSVWQYNAFESPNCGPLAEVGVDLVIHDRVRRSQEPTTYAGAFDPRVVCFELHPGFQPGILDVVTSSHARGVVLRAFGSGNVPSDVDQALPPAIERAVKRGVPVIIVSQVLRGGADLSLYACGTAAAKAGALDGGDLTTPAAVVKLMWGLHAGLDVDGMRELFVTSLRGEGGPARSA